MSALLRGGQQRPMCLTLGEAAEVIAGEHERQIKDISHAWLIAMLERQEKIPPLTDLTNPRESDRKLRERIQEQAEAHRELATLMASQGKSTI